MKDANLSLHLNLKGDTYLARVTLGRLSVAQVDEDWGSFCQYWGFQKKLFCTYATEQFCRTMQLSLVK